MNVVILKRFWEDFHNPVFPIGISNMMRPFDVKKIHQCKQFAGMGIGLPR